MTKEEAADKVKVARQELDAAEKVISDAAQLRGFILSIPGQTLATILAALRGSANNYYERDRHGCSVDHDSLAYTLAKERNARVSHAGQQLAAALYQQDRLEHSEGGAA